MEKPTEDTYVAELVSVIKEIAGPMGFDVEFNIMTPNGKPDLLLSYQGKSVAIIEIKRPKVDLSDPKLYEQAMKYAEWYRKNRNVQFYGIHNMRYLKVSRYIAEVKRKKTLPDFMGKERTGWVPVSDFPFKIMPWVKSIDEYKHISTHRKARMNLKEFLLKFKEIIEGKTLDLSDDVIETFGKHIEEGA